MEPEEHLKAALADRYPIEREIGCGGMATVYLATDLRHERDVAVKVFQPELAAALGSDRFLREIKITARLNHPHILPLLDSGKADSFLFYVMPFVDGESLREKMDRERELRTEDAVRITEQTASALAYAHSKGIVHRDLKPENVLLQSGQVVVADFGIALALDSAGGTRLTETGLSIGTPAYMSPEQVAGDREIDARSDLYSLGCVLYEMLAGDPPFTASNPRAVLAKHLTDPAPPVKTVRPGLPAAISSTIARALEKAPADRFGSATAFANALSDETPARSQIQDKSIVVLPFENLSPDPDQDYFSDGLAEELIADLSKINALRVISHNSSVQLKGTGKDTRTIGRELGVRYVMTGGVRRAGPKVRITAHLADTIDDSEVWTGKYGGELDDIFELQENVSRAIVEALHVSLSPAEEEKLGIRDVASPRAYDCYLRARQDIFLASKAGIERATRLLKDVMAIEGENPLLLAMSGCAYVLSLKYRWAEDEDWVRKEVDRLLKKLQEVEPESPREHFMRGMIALQRCDMRQAVHELEQSFIGDRNSPEVGNMLLNSYLYVGRDKVSVTPLIDHLLGIDPLTVMNVILSSAFDAFEGRVQIALDTAIRAVEMDPSGLWVLWAHSYFLALDGQNSAAAEVAARLWQMAPDWPWADHLCAVTAALQGDTNRARRFVTEHLIATAADDSHASLHLAEPYALMGMRDEAMAAIRNAIRLGFVHYPFFSQHNPFFEKLHEDPEFIELMKQAKAEWEYFATLPIPPVEA